MKTKSLLLVFLLSSFISLAQQSNNGYKIGDKIKDFSLQSTDNKAVSLASFKDAKGFIIVFTCNHCPFARMYEDRIISLNRQFAPQGYYVIAINSNDTTTAPEDSFAAMIEKVKEKSYTFPYLYDADQSVAKSFGAARTPHAFVLQKKGNHFELVYTGAIDDKPDNEEAVNEKFIKNAINQLLSGQHIVINTTKPVGCTIKWK